MKTIICVLIVFIVLFLVLAFKSQENFDTSFEITNNDIGGLFNPKSEQNNEDTQNSKCVYTPKGKREIDCVTDCYNNRSINDCGIDSCLDICGSCNDVSNCEWRKPLPESVARPQKTTDYNTVSCTFDPYGHSEKNCAEVCSSSPDVGMWGGKACTENRCRSICRNCKDKDWCWWLKDGKTKQTEMPPNSPNIFGVAGRESVILNWTHNLSNDNDKYIIVHYETANPDYTLTTENLFYKDVEIRNNYVRHEIKNLDYDKNYTFYVISSNENGLSRGSNLVNLKLQNKTSTNPVASILDQGKDNPNKEVSNINPSNDNTQFLDFNDLQKQYEDVKQNKSTCNKRNLFSDLRGKTLDIRL
jgi:hypothetical protein